MKHLLRQLYAHMTWANDVVIDALRIDPSPDAEALRLLAHIVAAEHLWYARIQARQPRLPVWPSLSLEQCASNAKENGAEYDALLDVLDDAGLQRVVHYRNSAGVEYDNTVVDILTHVAMHGCYHRGQIARQMRASGGTPAYTDYIGYVRRDQ
jgi:uncharacterized damage-inducible protein DinB